MTVASAYVHTGEAGTPRQDEKMRFLAAIGERLTGWAADGRYAVLTGDLNVAHTVDDLKNWKGNRGKAGFLPAEQAVFDDWFAGLGYVDVHRRLHGPGPGPYTWWSWRGEALAGAGRSWARYAASVCGWDIIGLLSFRWTAVGRGRCAVRWRPGPGFPRVRG